MNQPDQFKDSFRAAIDGAKSLPVQHLSTEEICAYHAGDKSVDEARIQEHLVGCRECAALLLELPAFSKQAGKSNTGEDVSRAWREFKSAAGLASGMSTPNVVVDFESRQPRRMSPLTVGLAIAASLIFVMLVGGIWLSRRRGAPTQVASHTEATPSQVGSAQSSARTENFPASSPTPQKGASPAVVKPSPITTPEQTSPSETVVAKNIVPVELYPNEALRGDGEAKAVQLAKDATTFSMVLHVARAQPSVAYSVVVKDSSGSTAWSAKVAFQKATNTFRLRIPAKVVSAGVYQISITRFGKEVNTVIAEYSVRFHQ